MSPRSRRCPLNRFPYAILYHIDGKHIVIVAVMHMRRNPDKWQEIARIERIDGLNG